jgi:hypothetical protein
MNSTIVQSANGYLLGTSELSSLNKSMYKDLDKKA